MELNDGVCAGCDLPEEECSCEAPAETEKETVM